MNEPMESIDLTPEQVDKFAAMMALLGWRAPGLKYIAIRMLTTNEKTGASNSVPVVTKSIPTAATDGQNCLINPDWFFKMTVPEMAFVYGHEVLHDIFGDVEFMHRCLTTGKVPQSDGSWLPFDEETFQHSADYRNNAILKHSGVGVMPEGGLYDPKIDGSQALIDIYGDKFKKKFNKNGKDKDGNGPNPNGGSGGFDRLLKPGTSTGQDAAAAQATRDDGAWKSAVASAEQLQKQHGSEMSAGMKRMFESLLNPEVDWKEHVRTLMNRMGGSGGWDFDRPDPWFTPHDFFSPRRTGKGARHIVVAGDTSGSRQGKEIASNISEIAGIIEDINPLRLTVVWWDTSIYVQELEHGSDLSELEPKGYGGTDVKPVYDWVDKLQGKPDVLLIFTDGEMTFPTPPTDVPIIWVSSTDKKYPYGDVVRVLKGGNQF